MSVPLGLGRSSHPGATPRWIASRFPAVEAGPSGAPVPVADRTRTIPFPISFLMTHPGRAGKKSLFPKRKILRFVV